MIRVGLIILWISILSPWFAHSQKIDVAATYPESLKSHPLYEKQVTFPRDTTLNGSVIDLEEYKDHLVLIHFWSLTCSGCYQEIPELNFLANEFKDRKVLIMSYMQESTSLLKDKIASNLKYYKLKKPVYGHDLIEFEIVPNANNIRSILASSVIPNSGVPITYFLKNGILKDLSFGYVIKMGNGNVKPSESANYYHLKGMIEKYLK